MKSINIILLLFVSVSRLPIYGADSTHVAAVLRFFEQHPEVNGLLLEANRNTNLCLELNRATSTPDYWVLEGQFLRKQPESVALQLVQGRWDRRTGDLDLMLYDVHRQAQGTWRLQAEGTGWGAKSLHFVWVGDTNTTTLQFWASAVQTITDTLGISPPPVAAGQSVLAPYYWEWYEGDCYKELYWIEGRTPPVVVVMDRTAHVTKVWVFKWGDGRWQWLQSPEGRRVWHFDTRRHNPAFLIHFFVLRINGRARYLEW